MTFTINSNLNVFVTTSALTNACTILRDTCLDSGCAAAVWASNSKVVRHIFIPCDCQAIYIFQAK